MGAVLEQMLPGLDAVLVPPVGGVRAACGPCQILAGQAVPRPELVETSREAFVGLGDRGVRFLPVTGSVFAVSCTDQHFLVGATHP